MKTKLGIISLGCPRNLVDSEELLGRLDLKGYSVVDIEQAEVALINTCAFIEEAKKESIEAILDLVELKKEGRLRKVIVYGCLAQRYKDILTQELPEVDAFIGKPALNHRLKRFPLTPKHFAYLKVSEGCVNACSFCVIPKIKGKLVSLPVNSIISQVEKFNRAKISELNIIGQDITGYGLDLREKTDLASLVARLAKTAKDIHWIRLLYLHPARITNELLSVIKDEPKVCKYIDLPVQHINDRILKLMNRKIAKKEIIKVITRVRKAISGVALRTSIIVGFPGETDKEFQELLTFVKEEKFERLGAFIYSAEEGTPAYNFKGQLPKEVKTERLDLIMSAQKEISTALNHKFLGKTLEVLVEEEDNGSYLGRTQFDAPEVDGLVYIKAKGKLRRGSLVKVNISDTLEYDLVGEVKE